MPKYVASRPLTQTAWNATLLGPDPSRAIARLKDQPGRDLIKVRHQPLIGALRLGYMAGAGHTGVSCATT